MQLDLSWQRQRIDARVPDVRGTWRLRNAINLIQLEIDQQARPHLPAHHANGITVNHPEIINVTMLLQKLHDGNVSVDDAPIARIVYALGRQIQPVLRGYQLDDVRHIERQRRNRNVE